MLSPLTFNFGFATSDEEKRQRLVRDAQLWERMAEYEEKNNPSR